MPIQENSKNIKLDNLNKRLKVLSILTKTQMTNNNEKSKCICGGEVKVCLSGTYGSGKEYLACIQCGEPFIAQEKKKHYCKCGYNKEDQHAEDCPKYASSPTQSVEEKRDCSKCGTKYGESTKWGTCECPVSPTQDLQKRFCLLMFQILI